MIRDALIDDSDDISELCKLYLGYNCNKDIVATRLDHLDHNRESVFVAVVDGCVAGFIHVEKYELLYAPCMANILGIAVSENYRRQGLGKALLFKAEEWAKSKGITMMRLNSGGTRHTAHMFYRNMGYNNEKEQIRFTKQL